MSAGTSTGALVRWAALAVAAAALAALAAGSPLLQRPRPKPHWPSRTHRPIPPGTDQGLYNEGFVEGDIVPRPTIKNAIADQNMLWPYATIIYKTDDGIGCPESPQCEILMQAMDHYHQKTCVRFKEWTGERDYVKIFFNPDSGACWSPVGRSGDGEQLLSLGQRCWYLGIVVHELGHAVGFWHEMNRPDRDSWIYIFWNNIIPVFAHAFAKQDAAYVDTLGEQFDYRSIMMYDEYAFSKDGSSPTIRPTQPGVVIGPIWKKTGLSASDVRRVHKLYKCQGNRNKWGFPYDVTCDFNRHVCGFKNGGSSVWNWKNNTRQDGFVYSTCESAGSTPGYFMSVNMHPSPDSARGCVRFWYLLQSNSELVLQLSQAHLDRVTQLSYDPDATRDLWESQETTGKWTRVEVPIDTSRPFKLIFMSSFSESCRRGTIALDDVEIRYRPCMASTGAMAGTPPLEEATPSPTAATAWPTTEATTHDPDALLPPLPPRPAVTQPLPPSHQAQEATAPPDDGGAAPDVPDHPHVAFEADFLPPKQGNEI